ncbi:MAG: efflux RND transporter permease subunit [Candidatus Krumholzibacteriia bacterium]|nr:efflux RND transporter permease subunit [bacterium]MCB9516227.1 efflux RND transporter permease subunit [Candidatus Latescibacterota bacterium]
MSRIDLPARSFVDRIIAFCLQNKLLVLLFTLLMIAWGVMVAPFDWHLGGIPRDPVAVDAIPDIGENQQIVFTRWPGRSPQDIEDQVGYPLTVSLLGLPGVKTVRSYSMFGFSTIYVIFDEHVEFYWSRSRLLEKLNSLPEGTLPPGVQPALGPDATALGQVFWYTLEGQDADGNPTGGWDLDELRSIQDWHVRYALMGARGVSEVASVGGFVREYQVDVDPDALRAYGVSLEEVFGAVKMANLDVGARSIEINRAEYVIRGIGFIKTLGDIGSSVIKAVDGVPIYVKNVATLTEGPALRRGALDKAGAEAVGGVVVVRYGENPLATIQAVKEKIAEIAPGLPRKTLADGTVSQVRIVPFYDRTGLIYETLGTLNTALLEEILVTIVVVILLLMHLRSSLLIAGLLPLAVLMSFIAMKQFGVDANIVALSGIAIAIGTMVDMGIVVSENIVRGLAERRPDEHPMAVIFRASSEVGSAVLTAVSTTVVSFLPVFTMQAAEGKLFKPLAFTKTFALVSSVIVALVVIPPFAEVLFTARIGKARLRRAGLVVLVAAGLVLAFLLPWWIGAVIALIGVYHLLAKRVPERWRRHTPLAANGFAVLVVGLLLAGHWEPLGPERGLLMNALFVALLVGSLMLMLFALQRFYGRMLAWCLDHKAAFLALPVALMLLGGTIWLGFDRVFGWVPRPMRHWGPVTSLAHAFPGLGQEFMPPLDEGSYLLMPTTMPHASIGEVQDVLSKQDMGIDAIPEVETAVGKLGRADSPLDPAPISMIETVINYRPKYLADKGGHALTFRYDGGEDDFFRDPDGAPVPAPDGEPYRVRGRFERDEAGRLIPDRHGLPFRLWRPALDPALNEGREAWAGIQSPDDIWDAILAAATIPGTTSAPKLQPIATRIVMLQSGMRAPMGIKVKGPDLETIEQVGLDLERLLKQVPSIEPASVFADRIVGKPYIEIEIDREAIARYGIPLQRVQDVIEVAVGGKRITTTVEGRERYPVRVRYHRELRDSIESLGRILVAAPGGSQIPLEQLARIRTVRGPQVIKSEDTFLTGYVLFDMMPGNAEVDVVRQARDTLNARIASGELVIPAGVSFTFAGSYQNQVRAAKKLAVVLPLALAIIFTILYLQFRSVSTTALVFSGIGIAWAGGFLMLWLYAQPWFMDVSVLGVGLRELFRMHTINLSVAVWVGFLALFGIASDDGVIMATYIGQVFERDRPTSREAVRAAVLAGAQRRIRPALMTAGTTILALVPVLTSTGRGADIMVPMAIPSFGGMVAVLLSVFTVPVLYSMIAELRLKSAATAPRMPHEGSDA